MPNVLIASHNAGKIREIRQIAAGLPLVWRSPDEFPQVPAADENGQTFAENARRKALHYAAATGLYVLADDSGLEVDALQGAPGVHSARFAGLPRNDDANNRKLIAALARVPEQERTARFRCAMALARGREILIETAGQLEGRIIAEPRGFNGFGYDPHFLIPELDQTVAELPPYEKNAHSHRGQALRAMLREMEALFRARGEWGP